MCRSSMPSACRKTIQICWVDHMFSTLGIPMRRFDRRPRPTGGISSVRRCATDVNILAQQPRQGRAQKRHVGNQQNSQAQEQEKGHDRPVDLENWDVGRRQDVLPETLPR